MPTFCACGCGLKVSDSGHRRRDCRRRELVAGRLCPHNVSSTVQSRRNLKHNPKNNPINNPINNPKNNPNNNPSDISSIDHLVMREFVSGPPRYHLAVKGVREQFVAVEQNSGP